MHTCILKNVKTKVLILISARLTRVKHIDCTVTRWRNITKRPTDIPSYSILLGQPLAFHHNGDEIVDDSPTVRQQPQNLVVNSSSEIPSKWLKTTTTSNYDTRPQRRNALSKSPKYTIHYHLLHRSGVRDDGKIKNLSACRSLVVTISSEIPTAKVIWRNFREVRTVRPRPFRWSRLPCRGYESPKKTLFNYKPSSETKENYEIKTYVQVCPWQHQARELKNLDVQNDAKLQDAIVSQGPRAPFSTALPTASLVPGCTRPQQRKTNQTFSLESLGTPNTGTITRRSLQCSASKRSYAVPLHCMRSSEASVLIDYVITCASYTRTRDSPCRRVRVVQTTRWPRHCCIWLALLRARRDRNTRLKSGIDYKIRDKLVPRHRYVRKWR